MVIHGFKKNATHRRRRSKILKLKTQDNLFSAALY